MTTQTEQEESKVSAPVRYWLGEIAGAQLREKDFRLEGRKVLSIYNGEKKDSIPFNILYSNTETLLPALYNSQPRPLVARRFKDADPVGKGAALAGQRALEYLVDTNSEQYASFDDVMADAVLDALLPGRGATRVKYDFESGTTEGVETVTYETICYESIKWDRWIFGYAKKWKKVPWIELQHAVTKEEATKLFGATVANKLKYTSDNSKDEDEKADDAKDDTSEEQDQKTCLIHEIWDKAGGRKVRFIADCYKEGYLKVDDDPLDLTGFYPIPEPLRFLRKSNDLSCTAIYKLYENQAKELNEITMRINKVVKAVKVRGVYDSTLEEEVGGLLKLEDNQMVGASNVAALQNGGLDKAIWLMPIEKLVIVLQQLYVAREACKRVIYEITGISDILRGASAASETLGAQEIKQNWATLRLKRLQKEVQRYARDLLRITLEIAGNKFEQRTFVKMTGLQMPTAQEQQAANGALAKMKAVAAMAQQAGQPIPPQLQQQAQTAMQVVQTPSWEACLGALKDQVQRQYKIDIETNSTVDLEATEDKKDLGEMLNAMAQFMNGVAPLVESGTLPFEAAREMLLNVVRKFRMGTDVEDQIKKMQAPKPKDDGKAAAAQMDAKIKEAQLQQKDAVDKANGQLEQQKAGHTAALEQQKFQFDQAKANFEAQSNERIEKMKLEAAARAKMAELQSARATAEMQAKIQQETDLRKTALTIAGQIQIAEMNAKVTAAGQANEQANAAKQTDAKAQESSDMAGLMEKVLETQNKLLEAVAAPKEVKFSSGRSATIGPKGKAK